MEVVTPEGQLPLPEGHMSLQHTYTNELLHIFVPFTKIWLYPGSEYCLALDYAPAF